MSKHLCIYHGNCADGFTAAWAVAQAFGEDNIEFHEGHYGQPHPDVTGRDVILVDFSYKRAVLEEMGRCASTILVLDHHKSARDDLAGFPLPLAGEYNPAAMAAYQHENNAPFAIHALFDMERSGAGIAWDYFNIVHPRPLLVDYVEDRDLWRFNLPQSREINAYIFAHDYTFPNWSALDGFIEDDDGQSCAALGGAIELKHHKDVRELVKASKRRMVIAGYDVPVANLPYTLSSDAGHLMAQEEPFAACYIDTPKGRTFSLRSSDDGADVSVVATVYGGGGHARAAGFTMPIGWEGE